MQIWSYLCFAKRNTPPEVETILHDVFVITGIVKYTGESSFVPWDCRGALAIGEEN